MNIKDIEVGSDSQLQDTDDNVNKMHHTDKAMVSETDTDNNINADKVNKEATVVDIQANENASSFNKY